MKNTIEAGASHGALYGFIKWLLALLFFLMALLFLPRFPIASVLLVISGLILLPPSARIISRKTNRVLPRWLKMAAIGLGLFVMFGILGSEAEKAAPSIADQRSSTPQQSSSQPATEEDQLRQIVSDQMKGNTNMGKARLRKVDVVKQANGGWGVFTEFNADDNLTMNMRKSGIETKMAEVFIALYTSGKDVRTATVAAYFPLVDKYGNESNGVVYKTSLNKAEADKINWDTSSVTLRRSIVPEVWATVLVSPEFR